MSFFPRGPQRPQGQKKTLGYKAQEGRSDEAAGTICFFCMALRGRTARGRTGDGNGDGDGDDDGEDDDDDDDDGDDEDDDDDDDDTSSLCAHGASQPAIL